MSIRINHLFFYLLAFLTILAVFSFSTAVSAEPCDETSQVTSTSEDPANYLEFSSVLDGKCQILSEGGKLRVVKNIHPDKNIRYRFVRMFSGKPQAGLVIGTIEHGNKPVKLGCTRVDGRDQSWEVKIARFIE